MSENLNPECCTHYPDTVHCGHIFCLRCVAAVEAAARRTTT